MDKTRMVFKGINLPITYLVFGGTYHHFLLPDDVQLGTNVSVNSPSLSAYAYKVGAPADKLLDLTFISPSYFSADTIIDGAVEFQVIPDYYFYASATASYYLTLTEVRVQLFQKDADGTETDIVPATNILSSTTTFYGNSTQHEVLAPCFFSYDVDSWVIPRTSRLCLTVKLYGYTGPAANYVIPTILTSENGDLIVSVPVVEGA